MAAVPFPPCLLSRFWRLFIGPAGIALMIEFYPAIKMAHVTFVILSGTVFLVRGIAIQAGGAWAMTAPLRYFSYSVDTLLLIAAVLLLTILPSALYANGWLTVKLSLLVLYVLLGTFALKRGRTARIRSLCFGAALLIYVCMYMVARTHDPLGPVHYLQRAIT